jgi:hypothetical protein
MGARWAETRVEEMLGWIQSPIFMDYTDDAVSSLIERCWVPCSSFLLREVLLTPPLFALPVYEYILSGPKRSNASAGSIPCQRSSWGLAAL